MLLFTAAHLEYNAGLVISIGSDTRPSPVRIGSTSTILARELREYRQTLVSTARPPSTPSDSVGNGTMFSPFVGVSMQSALDLCVAWSVYGLFMSSKLAQQCQTIPSAGPHSRRAETDTMAQ